MNTESAAQLFGVAKSTVIQWRKQPNSPIYDDELGMYSVIELGNWVRQEQIFKKGKGGVLTWLPDISRFPGHNDPTPVTMLPGMDDNEPPYREDPDDRIKRLRGDKLEMELQERAGELVNADELLIALSSMISRVKMRILNLPTSLASTVTGMTDRVEVQTMIEDKVHAALEELSTDPLQEIVDGE